MNSLSLESYKEKFKKDVGIFRFHPVLNPITKKVVELTPTTDPLFQEFVSRWVVFQLLDNLIRIKNSFYFGVYDTP